MTLSVYFTVKKKKNNKSRKYYAHRRCIDVNFKWVIHSCVVNSFVSIDCVTCYKISNRDLYNILNQLDTINLTNNLL